MTTLRSKLIHLAHAKPDVRPHVLPLLKQAGKKVTKDIRHPFYEAGDSISILKDAVAGDPATKADQKLKLALQDLEEAHDKVREALKPYDWD